MTTSGWDVRFCNNDNDEEEKEVEVDDCNS